MGCWKDLHLGPSVGAGGLATQGGKDDAAQSGQVMWTDSAPKIHKQATSTRKAAPHCCSSEEGRVWLSAPAAVA